MLRRPAITIILITPQRIVRADYGGGRLPQLVSLKQYPRPEVHGLAALVDVAISLRSRPGKQVLVLSTDFWVQNLSMSTNIVRGLSESDLCKALSFEVESLSGISSMTSALGYRTGVASSGSDGQPFWIAQSSVLERDEVENQIRRCGGRLVGLCHPGGVSGMMRQDVAKDRPCRRIELWPDNAICIYNTAQGDRHVQVINTDPHHSAWESEAKHWFSNFEPAEHNELLVGDGIVSSYSIEMSPAALDMKLYEQADTSQLPEDSNENADEADQTNEYHLERDEILERWLSIWARSVVRDLDDVPLIKPPTVPMSVQGRTTMAVVLTSLALLLCLGNYFYITHQESKLKRLTAAAEQPQKKLNRLTKEVGELEQQVKTLEESRDDLDSELRNWHELFITQKMRHMQLLTALAKSRPEQLIIKQIDSDSGNMKLSGICLHPQMANELSNKLHQQLSHYGWKVNPATKQMDQLSETYGTWRFEIVINPTSPDEQNTPQHVITSGLKKYTSNISGAEQ